MAYLKPFFLLLFSVTMVVASAEVVSYLVLKAGAVPRDIELFSYHIESSPYEIKSNISKRDRKPVIPESYAPFGDAVWPTNVVVDNIFQLQPNSEGVSQRLHPDGTVMLSFNVSADSFGRRKTAEIDREKHLLVMGCSFVFGEGVEQSDTIPEWLQRQTKEYRAYNLGYSGYTVDDIYLRAKKQNFLGGIPQREGKAIYVVMGDHVRRSFGAMRDYWRLEKNKLIQTNEYEFDAQGTYKDDLNVFMFIPYYFANSNFARLFNLDYPILTEARAEQFVKKIKALELFYKQRFASKNDFYVVLYPDFFDLRTRYYLRKFLEKHKIFFLDYSTYNINQFFQPIPRLKDGHPDSRAHRFFAELLIEDLQLL